jgi:uncharacterized protein YvpB
MMTNLSILTINDTYGYKNRKVDKGKFIEALEQMGMQAIMIEKEN